MNRAEMLARAGARAWDVIVIGGGATGAGVAVDAATRGYAVLLVEQSDFGKGTSSRSTKLVHGGVRYLGQGNLRLVADALRERGRLLRNAPHLVRVQPFVVPCYRWWEAPYYGIGLAVYDALAGSHGLGRSRYVNRREVVRRVPTVEPRGLRGGVVYHDGQFDDSRLLVNLIQTAAEHGAAVVNYARAVRLLADGGRVTGVVVRDEETGAEFDAPGRAVVNAAGAYCDPVRAMADPAAPPLVAPSQGVHLVFDRSFLPGGAALMVPKTADGRVVFAIPWHGHTLVGTTDVPVPRADLEPRATEPEVEFLLATAGRYLARRPTRADVLSVFAGIRPLVRGAGGVRTAALSRDHTIRTDRGLVTITGGKWTTYRGMAEDVVDRAAALARLPARPCRTKTLPVHGHRTGGDEADPLHGYGADAAAIRALPGHAERLHAALPYTAAEVAWAARHEMARTVEDVLARRLRALVLNADAAVAMAPRVAELLAAELGKDAAWREEQVRRFVALADGYRIDRL